MRTKKVRAKQCLSKARHNIKSQRTTKERSPLLSPAAELLSSIFNLGWISRSQIITAYGQLGHRLIVFLRQIKVVTERVQMTQEGIEHCYFLADKRFSQRSPEELTSAIVDAAHKAGVSL